MMPSTRGSGPAPTLAFVQIDGFRCYAPELARECADYPSEAFDVTAAVQAASCGQSPLRLDHAR
jgi:hypothetical protein